MVNEKKINKPPCVHHHFSLSSFIFILDYNPLNMNTEQWIQWIVLLPSENEIFKPISVLAKTESENMKEAFKILLNLPNKLFLSFYRLLILDFMKIFLQISFVGCFWTHHHETASSMYAQCACVDRYSWILWAPKWPGASYPLIKNSNNTKPQRKTNKINSQPVKRSIFI